MAKVKFAAKARLNASLHRRSYSGGRVSPGWYLVYREAGRQRWVKCVGTDGNPLTRRAEAEAFRQQWLDHRERVGTGRADSFEAALDSAVGPHLAAYLADRTTGHKPVEAKRLKTLRAEITHALADMKVVTLRGLTATAVNGYLGRRAADKALSHHTLNGYRDSLSGFCKYLKRAKLIPANPITPDDVPRFEWRKRSQRKASLRPATLRKLVEAARSYPLHTFVNRGGGRPRADGTPARRSQAATVSPATAARLEREGLERALTYRLALATGLRRGELSRVRVEHLHKDRLLVPGELLKVKVDDAVTFLLPPVLAADLGRPRPAGPLVDISEAANWVRMHQRLLAHAGVRYTNRKAHVRSFHSLRKSARVWLERAGCTYTDQKRYLRHAGRDVTERNYSTLGDGRPVNGGRVFRLLCALDGYLTGSLAKLPAAKRPASRRAG